MRRMITEKDVEKLDSITASENEKLGAMQDPKTATAGQVLTAVAGGKAEFKAPSGGAKHLWSVGISYTIKDSESNAVLFSFAGSCLYSRDNATTPAFNDIAELEDLVFGGTGYINYDGMTGTVGAIRPVNSGNALNIQYVNSAHEAILGGMHFNSDKMTSEFYAFVSKNIQ